MALIKTDWTGELTQVENSIRRVVDSDIGPMIERAINQAGQQLNEVVEQAGTRVEDNIKLLSKEIHDQRQLSREDLKDLVDYAAQKLGQTIDDRLSQAKHEATQFVTERIQHLKTELEDAAKRSRKTLYANVAISILSALSMAVLGIIYKKISIGELDLYSTFRVFLLSTAVGTGIYATLKAFHSWFALNRAKKNAATVLINHLSVFRPNGAVGIFLLAIALFIGWYFATFYSFS
jgi:gas vesicle protein